LPTASGDNTFLRGNSNSLMSTRTKEDFLNGQLLLIDKPLGWTSFQAVNKLKWSIRKRFDLKKIKIGHAGTLDPLATGLLLICTGKFTKTINDLQGQEKEYTGTITLGSSTPSYDLETEKIEQQPPIFSALKKGGKRLYEYAREGKKVEIKTRQITISEFEIIGINMPDINFRVVCSKGTYIRSLAHDFGKALKSGGHLSGLRRTKIGDYNVHNALDPTIFSDKLLAEE